MSTSIALETLIEASEASRQQEIPAFSPQQLYESLRLAQPTESIRVLDLETTTDPGSPLGGTLRVVSLNDQPHFSALSYVWGTDRTRSILCNGCTLPITRNCHDALLSMRASQKGTAIWVDAICINQKDDEEKAGQISLMQEIYTWAAAVFIWLGPDNDACDQALDSIRMVSKLRPPRLIAPWVKNGHSMTLCADKLSRIGLLVTFFLPKTWSLLFQPCIAVCCQTHCSRAQMDQLLDHAWLHRVWTFQEVVLASNPVIICGNQLISWSVLQQALDYYYDQKHHTGGSGDGYLIDINFNTTEAWLFLIYTWATIERPTEWRGISFRRLPDARKSISIEDYMKTYLNFYRSPSVGILLVGLISFTILASPIIIAAAVVSIKRRENHWGLMGLLFLPGLQLIPVCALFIMIRKRKPARNESLLVVLAQALRERAASDPKDKSFAMHGVLGALGVPCAKADYSRSLGQIYCDLFVNLLQWNPRLINLLLDTGSPLDNAPSWVPDWNSLQQRAFVSSEYVYRPLRTRKEPQNFKVDHKTLTVQAAFLDVATSCSGSFGRIDAMDFETTHRDRRQALFKTLRQFASWFADGRSYMYELDVLQVLEAQGQWYDSGNINLPIFERWRGALTGEDSITTPPSDQVLLDRISADPDLRIYTVKVCNSLHKKRSLFVTQGSFRGGVRGSGPPHMQVDDKVVRVSGVSMPMILRESEEPGKYWVIGPAFVDGMTHWWWGEEDDSDLEWTSLTLI